MPRKPLLAFLNSLYCLMKSSKLVTALKIVFELYNYRYLCDYMGNVNETTHSLGTESAKWTQIRKE